MSCSKKKEPQQESYIHFTANGTVYEWSRPYKCDNINCVGYTNGTFLLKDPTGYILISDENAPCLNCTTNTLRITIPLATISVGTYTNTVLVATTFWSAPHRAGISALGTVEAASTQPNDFATVTITSIHDGNLVNGTFSARLTQNPHDNTAPKLDILSGEFRNVQILQ